MEAMAQVGWVDWTLLAVLALSLLVGLVRGFVFEVMSLAGWVVAWFAAQWFAADLAPQLPVGVPGSSLNHAAAFALCFLAAIIVWSLLSRLIRMLLHATPLSLADRALGAGFGLLRGAVLLLAVTTVVALTPAAQSQPWRESRGTTWLNTAMHGLKPLLPAQVAGWLPV
jgi:membrane protein required for colicin V production